MPSRFGTYRLEDVDTLANAFYYSIERLVSWQGDK